jgi:hypothetical protein
LRPYFTVSDLRLPFSSPPTTRRVTVEVFDSASTRVTGLRLKVKVILRPTVSRPVTLLLRRQSVRETFLLQCFSEPCRRHLFQQQCYCVLSRHCALNGSLPWISASNQLKLHYTYQNPSNLSSIVACVT